MYLDCRSSLLILDTKINYILVLWGLSYHLHWNALRIFLLWIKASEKFSLECKMVVEVILMKEETECMLKKKQWFLNLSQHLFHIFLKCLHLIFNICYHLMYFLLFISLGFNQWLQMKLWLLLEPSNFQIWHFNIINIVI